MAGALLGGGELASRTPQSGGTLSSYTHKNKPRGVSLPGKLGSAFAQLNAGMADGRCDAPLLPAMLSPAPHEVAPEEFSRKWPRVALKGLCCRSGDDEKCGTDNMAQTSSWAISLSGVAFRKVPTATIQNGLARVAESDRHLLSQLQET